MKLSSARQEIVKSTLEDKLRMQSRATEQYDQIFEEVKELEENKSEEPQLIVQRSTVYGDIQNDRDEARRLQRSGRSRRTKEADSQDLSFESCRSSVVDYTEEMSPESPRKSQGVQVVMSETAGKAMRGREEDAWRRWKPKLFRTVWKASTWTPW